eukprot:scaffold266_cov391-Prasinococcus_capsulatus_cf.AAC.23
MCVSTALVIFPEANSLHPRRLPSHHPVTLTTRSQPGSDLPLLVLRPQPRTRRDLPVGAQPGSSPAYCHGKNVFCASDHGKHGAG